MKQTIDTFTMELPGIDTEQGDTNKTYYMFYIRTHSAQTEWCGLTRKQARDMYAFTNAHQPSNVIAFGWEELK